MMPYCYWKYLLITTLFVNMNVQLHKTFSSVPGATRTNWTQPGRIVLNIYWHHVLNTTALFPHQHERSGVNPRYNYQKCYKCPPQYEEFIERGPVSLQLGLFHHPQSSNGPKRFGSDPPTKMFSTRQTRPRMASRYFWSDKHVYQFVN